MTKPQQSLERQHERLEQETREELNDNSSGSTRKAPGGEPWGNDHPVNIRLSIPLLIKRYYVTIIAGEERRIPERLSAERRKHPLVSRGNLVFFALVGTVIGLAGLALIQFATMYLLDQSGALGP